MATAKRSAAKAFGLGPTVGALLLGALAQWLVYNPVGSVPFLPQLAGWGLFALGGWLLLKARRAAAPAPQALGLSRGAEAAALAAVLLLALCVRLYNLPNYPAGGFRDEGENGSVARQLMLGEPVTGTGLRFPVYIEANTQNAAGYFYPLAVFFKAFGVSILSERYLSVFFGVLAVGAFWALARGFFGPALGLFLAACLALLRWHVNFSRIGFLGIMTVFLSLPMLYGLYRGLRAPAEAPPRGFRPGLFGLAVALAVLRGGLGFALRPGALDFWLGLAMGLPLLYFAWQARREQRAGWLMLGALALALSMYSYIAARLFVVLVALLVAHHLLTQQRELKRKEWGLLGAALGLGALGGSLLVAGSAWVQPGLMLLGKGLAGMAGLGLLAFWLRTRDLLRGWGRPLGLALGLGLVVAGPLYAYTLSHQKEVAARSYRVSIFNDEEGDASWGRRPWGFKLASNLAPTMGMINVRGDGNPRHNLPGATMLNPLWAALFGLGVFYALGRLKDPRAFLALALWQISLLAGYYSIEAPQAYRCISAIPAALLFTGLVGERALSAFRRRGELGLGLGLGLLASLLALGGAWELKTYFVDQPKHPGVWAEFSTGEYMMGEELAALNRGGLRTRGLVKPDWADSYTFRFLTLPERNFEHFEVAKHVPIQAPLNAGGQDFLYILGGSYRPLAPVLKQLYPGGEYQEKFHPLTKDLLYWTYRVDAKEAAAAKPLRSGLRGRYYADIPQDRSRPELGPHWVPQRLQKQQADPLLLFDWSVAPLGGYFSAEWNGSLRVARGGTYAFELESNSYGLLEIDGRKVVERPFLPPGKDVATGRVNLQAGRHRIRVRYFEARNYSKLSLRWITPEGVREVVPTGALSPD